MKLNVSDFGRRNGDPGIPQYIGAAKRIGMSEEIESQKKTRQKKTKKSKKNFRNYLCHLNF